VLCTQRRSEGSTSCNVKKNRCRKSALFRQLIEMTNLLLRTISEQGRVPIMAEKTQRPSTPVAMPPVLGSPPSHPPMAGRVWVGKTRPSLEALSDALKAEVAVPTSSDEPRNK
jgi:hypothetical protein